MKTSEPRSSKANAKRPFGWLVGLDVGRLLLGTVVAVPLLWVVGYSLAYSLGMIGLLSEGVTLRHWRAALADGSATGSLVLSTSVAATSTFIAVTLALTVVILEPRIGQNKLILAALCVGLGTPSAVMAMMTYQMLSGGGLVARLAFHLELVNSPNDFPVLVGDRWAVGIIVAQAASASPLLLLYFSQLWRTIKADRLCELAYALGASHWQVRRLVALPMLVRRGRAMMLLLFMLNLGSYEVPLLLGRQSPQMLSVLTQRRSGIFDLSRRPEAYVLASVYFVLTATVLVTYLGWRRRDV